MVGSSENLRLLKAAPVQQPPCHNSEPAQDTPEIENFHGIAPVDLDNARQASEALSTSSRATLVASDSTTDIETDDFHDLFERTQMMTDVKAYQCRDPVSRTETFARFLQLPDELQIKIIAKGEICPVGQIFRPFYKQGMLKGYILNRGITSRDQIESNTAVSDKETMITYVMGDNVDFLGSAFLSMKFARSYINAFYSHNQFVFDDPRAAMWFFKLLGSKFQYLRQVDLLISGGLEGQYERYSPAHGLTETLEELWWGVICWIEHRHNFDCLSLTFEQSPSEYELRWRTDKEMAANILMFRQKIVCRLGRCWGIRNVKIEDKLNSFFENSDDVFEAQLAMQQTEIDARVEDKRKAPLLPVLEAAGKRSDYINDRVDFAHSVDTGITYKQEEEDDVKDYQSHKAAAGWRKNPGLGSRTTYSTSKAQVKEAKQQQKTKTQRSDFQAAQPSRLTSIVNSIGNHPRSPSSHQTNSGTINPRQFYGSGTQRQQSSPRVNDIWTDFDRLQSERSSPRRSRHSGNRRSRDKHYGSRRHTFWNHDT